jgi:hypothetical protein
MYGLSEVLRCDRRIPGRHWPMFIAIFDVIMTFWMISSVELTFVNF